VFQLILDGEACLHLHSELPPLVRFCTQQKVNCCTLMPLGTHTYTHTHMHTHTHTHTHTPRTHTHTCTRTHMYFSHHDFNCTLTLTGTECGCEHAACRAAHPYRSHGCSGVGCATARHWPGVCVCVFVCKCMYVYMFMCEK